MNKAIYDILYKYIDEDGNIGEDLYEVQLLDDISPERTQKLIALLGHQNEFITYQAMLILLAWGVDEGFDKLDNFIAEESKEEFEPHRIYGEDNVYDVVSHALYISTYNTENEDKIIPYLKKILATYGDKFFESKLKYVLLNMEKATQLLPEIKVAITSALDNKRYYQASQLLPVIAKFDKTPVNKYAATFTPLIQKDKRIEYNLQEMKEHL